MAQASRHRRQMQFVVSVKRDARLCLDAHKLPLSVMGTSPHCGTCDLHVDGGGNRTQSSTVHRPLSCLQSLMNSSAQDIQDLKDLNSPPHKAWWSHECHEKDAGAAVTGSLPSLRSSIGINRNSSLELRTHPAASPPGQHHQPVSALEQAPRQPRDERAADKSAKVVTPRLAA
ncbi:Hypothetical protein SMAX5B_005541 [Scophthalmus maximus]|uniref:Uncharacterized protein n=1 Tax=Scophthalmus maximus TaxID=52904 RepID=A0A2U9AWG7_SCOMX|nr:Hypothetical protein SMAX5B_005541 [Scophthalmus maximus]